VIAALTFIIGLLAGSLRSYASKKGENLATKEDLTDLTTIARSIEAKISHETWGRQKHWEMKWQSAHLHMR
jgi:hypothetical protein